MPIDIHVPAGPTGPVWGPGLALNLFSDLVGPIPIDWEWHVDVGFNPEGGAIAFSFVKPASEQHSIRITPWVDTRPLVSSNFTLAPQANVHINAELRTPGNVVQDSGTANVIWDTTVALPETIQESISGGFTDGDRQLITASERRSQVLGEPTDLILGTPSGPQPFTLATLFSRNTLDLLTLEELTSGVTCEPVRATVPIWAFGIIVRVIEIDPELTPRTPDDQWYFPDLAVLRYFRGADLMYRRGIHTPTFMTDDAWEKHWTFRDPLEVLGVPPDNTLAVDWRQGCCGQVFLMKWP